MNFAVCVALIVLLADIQVGQSTLSKSNRKKEKAAKEAKVCSNFNRIKCYRLAKAGSSLTRIKFINVCPRFRGLVCHLMFIQLCNFMN